MIKKIGLFVLTLIILNNCGYKPIYSKKNYNFEIKNIEMLGETKINKLLSNKLKVYKNNPEAENTLNMIINSQSFKTTITKDKKGNPTQFSMSINVDVKIIDDSNNQTETTFSENSTYDNSNNKFDLRKYEDNLIKNMSEKIFSEITLFIQTKN
tara:strand:- start:200 stop:661 length:462 start_codon:yes stop_codon:yes gene_type:complete